MVHIAREYLPQLSNLWWMPNSVCSGFGTAMRMGSFRLFKRYTERSRNTTTEFFSKCRFCHNCAVISLRGWYITKFERVHYVIMLLFWRFNCPFDTKNHSIWQLFFTWIHKPKIFIVNADLAANAKFGKQHSILMHPRL